MRARYLVTALLIALFLVVAGYLGWRFYELRQEMGEVMAEVGETRELVARLSPLGDVTAIESQWEGWADLRRRLANLENRLVKFKNDLGPIEFILPLAGIVPGVGGDVSQGPRLLQLGLALTRAGQSAIDSLDLVVGALSESTFGGNLGGDLLQLRAEALGPLRIAHEELEKAERARKELDRTALSSRLLAFVDFIDERLPQWQETVEMAMDGLSLAGSLLGVEAPKTLLILGQDDAEIRATGGFIGPVWQITFSRGDIAELRFLYSFEVDAKSPVSSLPPPPEPMFKYMWSGTLYFRDANWYPDFPTSAKILKRLYEEAQGTHVDGVIALTRPLMAHVLGAIGPIQIPDTNVVAQKDNVVDALYHYAGPAPLQSFGAKPRPPRVWFAEQLGHALHDRIQRGLTGSELAALIQALLGGARQKHLLIYMEDEPMEELVLRNNWGGQLLASEGDYLLVVESNMFGLGDLSQSIQRRMNYGVILSEGAIDSQLALSYQNTSPKRSEPCVQPDSCYWNYLRVYVPGESELLVRPEFPLPEGSLYYRAQRHKPEDTFSAGHSEQADTSVWGGFWVLPPGKAKTLSFEYRQPWVMTEETDGVFRYQLLIQKQAGIAAMPLDVSVSFPDDWEVIKTEPDATRIQPGMVQFEAILDADRWFRVLFRPKAGK